MSGQEGIDPTAAIGHHPDEQSIFGQSALCGFALRDVPEGVIFRLATIPALVTCSVCSELAWPWLSDLLAAARAEGAEKARAEGAADAANAFMSWAAKNEIAEPPLDWAWFGEIARRYSPLYEGNES